MRILLDSPKKKRCQDDTMKIDAPELVELIKLLAERKKTEKKDEPQKKESKPPSFGFGSSLALLLMIWPFMIMGWAIAGAYTINFVMHLLHIWN